jgi:hypothetical protein
MTFTELEYVLMIEVLALLWRGAILSTQRDRAHEHAMRYAEFLMATYRGTGKVIKTDEGYSFIRTNHETSNQARQG